MPYSDSLLVPAVQAEVPAVIRLIEKRILWMQSKEIVQWAMDYLELYDYAYFSEAVRKKQLYVLKKTGKIIAAVLALEEEPRWTGVPGEALYLRHLAADPSFAGAGHHLLACCERLAAQKQKRALRLDCQTGAKKLNGYYRSRGFHFRGYCKVGEYKGNRREKKIRHSS